MNKKKSIGAFFGGLVHNNKFLMILSIFLALFVWMYILYIVNPVNETVFDKVEVDLAFEGSVPDRNGYMYLMTDPNLTVSVTVSGSRSELINLSKEDIKATLNMDSVISEGTYSINVSTTNGNNDLTVTEIYPKTFTIEFAAEETREIPVELLASGTLPSGYEIENQSVSPQTITVRGPAKTVAGISKAYLTVPLTNMKENITGAYDITLVNEAGENIDRRYLTLSETSAEAVLEVCYRKTLATSVEITNSFGSYNEASFVSVTLDTPYIKATGPEKDLSALESFSVGTIDTSQFAQSGTVTLQLPAMEGVTFNTDQVTATVTIAKDTDTKTLTFNTTDITCTNVPTGKIARIDAGTVSVRIRGKAEEIKKLTAENLKCVVDMSEGTEDGKHPIFVTPTASVSGIAFDVIGNYSVKVNVQ